MQAFFGYGALLLGILTVAVYLRIFVAVFLPKAHAFVFVGFLLNACQKLTLIMTQDGAERYIWLLDNQLLPFAETVMYLCGLLIFWGYLKRSPDITKE